MSGIVGSRFNIRGSGLVGSLGTDGQVFTSSGAGVGAAYEAAAGGGKILQVVTRNTNTTMNTTSTDPVATDCYAAITPTADSSTILVTMSFKFAMARAGASPNTYGGFNGYLVYRDIAGAGYNVISPDGVTYGYNRWGYSRDYNTLPTIYLNNSPTLVFLDSPSSVAECTYKLYVESGTAGTDTYFGNGHNQDYTILMEIDGS